MRLSRLLHNQTVRNGSLFSFFSFLNSGIGFLLLIVLARFISPAGYGHLNLFNLVVTLFNYFVCLNTTGIIAVNFFRKSGSEFRRTVNSVFLLTCVCGMVLALITFLFRERIETWTGLSLSYQLTALSVCFFNVFTQVNLNIWRIEEKVLKYGVYSTTLVLSNFVLTLVFVILLHQNWVGRIHAQFLVGAVFFLASLFFLVKRKYLTKVMPRKADIKDCLSFGLPLIPHNMSFWIRQGLDRIFLNTYQSTTLVGLFSFSLNFANIIQLVADAFNATNSVYIYKNLAKNEVQVRQRLRRQTLWLIAFFLVFSVIVCVGAMVFIPTFFPEYSGCTVYLVYQCGGAFFQSLYLQFVNYLFYFKKTRVLMYITFSVSILHALSSLWLTRYSIYYTVLIGLLSNMLIAVGVFLYSRRVYRVI